MPETGLSSSEGLEMGMRARQGRKLLGEGGQHPVPSSHHCALFNLHNCVSRARRISLHFEFPAFCRLTSRELLFETRLLLWSLQKRNLCPISMCPGLSVGSQRQGSCFKGTWAIEMQTGMPNTRLGLGLVRHDYSSWEELLSQKLHNNHLCVRRSKDQLVTCSAGADFSAEIVLIMARTTSLTQICRGFGFIEQAPNSQSSFLPLLLLLPYCANPGFCPSPSFLAAGPDHMPSLSSRARSHALVCMRETWEEGWKPEK